jgi:ribosomal-protein-alanine N-acetyltransferase
MHMMVEPMAEKDAARIVTWQYEPPYDLYNLSQEDFPGLMDPVKRTFAVRDERGETIGFCCFGREARVPGGDYVEIEPVVLDVGVALHPCLVGGGLGDEFVNAVLAFAIGRFKPERFRVTVAEFNTRSRKTFLKLGFQEVYRFGRIGDGLEFVRFEWEPPSDLMRSDYVSFKPA